MKLVAERQGALQVWLQHAVESRGDALALLHFLGLAGDLPEETTQTSDDAVEVAAPPGGLGIIFENVYDATSREFVHRVKMVKPESPLRGEIFIGDRLLVVDGERTRLLETRRVGQRAQRERRCGGTLCL